MEAPRRKITAKVDPNAVYAASTRTSSRASSPADAQTSAHLVISSISPSPPLAIRPKAKVSSGAATSSLKPPAKPSNSTIGAGKRTPVSSVVGRATRERPVSLVGTPTSRSPVTPFGQNASPMVPPSRRAPSPQPRPARRVPSPVPQLGRQTTSQRAQPVQRVKSPIPPKGRNVLSPSPSAMRRTASPPASHGRRLMAPTHVPPLTIPRRTTSPTRSGLFDSRSIRSPHRRIASASDVSSAVSNKEKSPTLTGDPSKSRRLPASMSAITLSHPSTFSAIPRSPPKSAYPVLASPPPLPAADPDAQLHHRDSSPEPSDIPTPPSAPPQALLSVQNSGRLTASAPATPNHISPGDISLGSDVAYPQPRTSDITIGPSPNGSSARPRGSGTTEPDNEKGPAAPREITANVRVKAKVSVSGSPSGASIRPAAQARPQQTTIPPRGRSGSISASSSFSGFIQPLMVSGASGIRVLQSSRILSPPPGSRVPGLAIIAPGSYAMRSPPGSTLSSVSSSSQTSLRSRGAGSSSNTGDDRAITPTDLGLRPKTGPRVSGLGLSARLLGPDDEGPDRDDSGIDMFEADDADLEQDQREEARSNRKIADLEISNKSLLTVNAMLESTKARQAKEIRDLRRRLRESRLVLPPRAYIALEETDPLEETGRNEAEEEDSDEDENDVTQDQADETYARVRTLLDGLLSSAKTALETKPETPNPKSGRTSMPIRVLNVHEVEQYADGDGDHDADDTGDSKATESVAEDLDSVDEDGPSAILDKANQEKEGSTPKYESSSFRLRGLMNWR